MRYICLCLISTSLWGSLCQASDEAVGPDDCLVIILSTTPAEGRAGTGFAIGDGTLVVTAYHVVAEASAEGQHRMLGVVKIVSPYLGQCSYAQVVAVSKQHDLVMFKVPWKGHPAFELADDRELLQAADLETIGMVSIVSAIPAEFDRPFPPSFSVGRAILEIDFVAVRQQVPQFISLAGRAQLGPGWSGAPMILPGTRKAAGCFVRLNKSVSDGQLTSQGPALAQARRLAAENNQSQSLTAPETLLRREPDGYQAARLFLQAYKALVRDDYQGSSTKTEELLTLRPQTPIFHVLAAQLQEKQKNYEKAQTHYRSALELDPETPMIQMMYGQFLLERDPNRALETLEGLWEHEQMRPWLALIMWNDLQREQIVDEHHIQLLQEALAVEPGNAYLWFNLGATQLQQGRSDEGFQSMTKAVELFPERSAFRGQLARLLENDGRLDEAEGHFRRLLEIEPENPVVYFWFARFLARHRPPAKALALNVAQKALALLPGHGLPREEVEQLIREIQQANPPDEEGPAIQIQPDR